MLMLIYVDWLACPYKLGGLHFLMEIVIGAMKTSRRLSVSGISCIVCRGNLMFAIPGTKWCSLPSRAILAILWPGKNTELVGLQRYTKYTSYDAQYAKSCHVIGFWSILQAFVELALAWTSCSPWLAIMHCEFLPIIWQIRIGMLYVYVCFIYSFFNPVHGRDDAADLEVRDAIWPHPCFSAPSAGELMGGRWPPVIHWKLVPDQRNLRTRSHGDQEGNHI